MSSSPASRLMSKSCCTAHDALIAEPMILQADGEKFDQFGEDEFGVLAGADIAEQPGDPAIVAADIHHAAVNAVQPPIELSLAEMAAGPAQQADEALRHLVIGVEHHLPHFRIGIDRAQP